MVPHTSAPLVSLHGIHFNNSVSSSRSCLAPLHSSLNVDSSDHLAFCHPTSCMRRSWDQSPTVCRTKIPTEISTGFVFLRRKRFSRTWTAKSRDSAKRKNASRSTSRRMSTMLRLKAEKESSTISRSTRLSNTCRCAWNAIQT